MTTLRVRPRDVDASYQDELLERWTVAVMANFDASRANASKVARANLDRRLAAAECVAFELVRNGEVVGTCLLEPTSTSDGAPWVVSDLDAHDDVAPNDIMSVLLDIVHEHGGRALQMSRSDRSDVAARVIATRPHEVAATRMLCDLQGPSSAPSSTVELTAMDDDEFAEFFAGERDSYARSIADSGLATYEDALVESEKQLGELLPDGRETKGQSFYVGRVGGQRVGSLWLSITDDGDGLRAYVYNVEVDEPSRGRGYGRGLMLAAEHAARAAGCQQIGLNVFGFNHVARALYDSLGYVARVEMVTIPAT